MEIQGEMSSGVTMLAKQSRLGKSDMRHQNKWALYNTYCLFQR
jgi:hypothetical protein